jgi:hypothetical protein
MWVREPVLTNEASGIPGPFPPFFWAARLGCEGDAHWTDWTTFGTVDVYNDAIVPGAVFETRVLDQTCDPANPDNYSGALTVHMSAVGDVVGRERSSQTGLWDPPQGTVDFVDISAVVEKFKNAPDAPRKARADVINSDVENPLPDRKVDYVDISHVVGAFRGEATAPVGPPSTDPCLP